jgi:hypothetical protein
MGSHAEPLSAGRRIKAKEVANPGVYAIGSNYERPSPCLPVHLQADDASILENGGLHDGSRVLANPRCNRCGVE